MCILIGEISLSQSAIRFNSNSVSSKITFLLFDVALPLENVEHYVMTLRKADLNAAD